MFNFFRKKKKENPSSQTPSNPGSAAFKIAENYSNGEEGFKRDPHSAYRWYRLAAEQGNKEAQKKIGMSSEQIIRQREQEGKEVDAVLRGSGF